MGTSKQKTTTEQVTTQQAKATPEEEEINKLELERRRGIQPQVLGLDQETITQARRLARGEQLGGQFGSLGMGITDEVQQDIINKSLRDIAPQFEALGIGFSGPAMQISANLARDIRVQSEMEKIRQRENLLNVLQGFPTAAQQPALAETQLLSNRLQGLRTITGSSRGTSTYRYNPFQESFMSSFGTGLGKGTSGGIGNVFAKGFGIG